jgi:hypothetical protein
MTRAGEVASMAGTIPAWAVVSLALAVAALVLSSGWKGRR